MLDVNSNNKIEVEKKDDAIVCPSCGTHISMWEKKCPNSHCKKELEWTNFIFS